MTRIRCCSFWCCLLACGDSVTPPDGGARDSSGGLSDAGECVPGAERSIDCGRCGTASQLCSSSGIWAAPAACEDEGTCVEGTTETEATLLCGERTRQCETGCVWGEWAISTPDGECERGSTSDGTTSCSSPSETPRRTCSADCVWGPDECVNACAGTRRVTPADAEEVCVPAGPYMRGDAMISDATPVSEVTLSGYYIDRYPVTNRRYRECVDAGPCGAPEATIGRESFADLGREGYPVQGVTRTQARDFCEWDGRRLPTEAEWEKAARGPAPRRNRYPWGDVPNCVSLAVLGCPGGPASSGGGVMPDLFDALPGSATFYGVEMMVGGGQELLFDAYGASYYGEPGSTTDPRGPDEREPDAGGESRRVVHGHPRFVRYSTEHLLSYRSGWDITLPWAVIRCARSAL